MKNEDGTELIDRIKDQMAELSNDAEHAQLFLLNLRRRIEDLGAEVDKLKRQRR